MGDRQNDHVIGGQPVDRIVREALHNEFAQATAEGRPDPRVPGETSESVHYFDSEAVSQAWQCWASASSSATDKDMGGLLLQDQNASGLTLSARCIHGRSGIDAVAP